MRGRASAAIGEPSWAWILRKRRRGWTIRTQSPACASGFLFRSPYGPPCRAAGVWRQLIDGRGPGFPGGFSRRIRPMPAGRHADAAPAWVIRSVAVRTRDGPERLDQVYRRLTDNTPRDDAPTA